MKNSNQRKPPDEYVSVDYFQGRWRVSIGGKVLLENVEGTKIFQLAGRLAEEQGLGVALYQPNDEDKFAQLMLFDIRV